MSIDVRAYLARDCRVACSAFCQKQVHVVSLTVQLAVLLKVLAFQYAVAVDTSQAGPVPVL